jgi:hypothetical protein
MTHRNLCRVRPTIFHHPRACIVPSRWARRSFLMDWIAAADDAVCRLVKLRTSFHDPPSLWLARPLVHTSHRAILHPLHWTVAASPGSRRLRLSQSMSCLTPSVVKSPTVSKAASRLVTTNGPHSDFAIASVRAKDPERVRARCLLTFRSLHHVMQLTHD